MKAKHLAAFIGLGLAWGSSFFWIKIALEEIGPFSLVALRLLFGLVGLLIGLAVRKPTIPKQKRVWLAIGILGLTNSAIPFTLISWSEQYVDSSLVSILVSIVPIFTAVMAHFLIPDEKLNGKKAAGVVGGFIGVIILFWPNLHSNAQDVNLGILAILGASLFFAISGIIARRETTGADPMIQSFGSLLVADAVMWASVPLAEPGFTLPVEFATWGSLIWLGLIGSGLAYHLYYNLLANIGPTRTSMVTYLMPAIGLGLGVTFLGENFDLLMLIGGALILVSIWVVNNSSS